MALTDPIYLHQDLTEQLARTAQAALWIYKKNYGLKTSDLPSRLGVSTGKLKSVLWPKSPPPVRAALVVLASDPINARLALRDVSSTFGSISLADRADPAGAVKSSLRYLVLKVQEIEGITQTALASRLGTSPPWVSRLHRQVRRVWPRTLVAHLDRLGLGLRLTVPGSGTVELGSPTYKMSDHTGYVYVSYNSIQDLVKVGRTIRSTHKRLNEISRTADSPGRYKLVDAKRTLHYRALEEALLEDLSASAVEGEREFFDVDPSRAARRLHEVARELN
jgi:transcriptional regulator with XRE-family HTH domain